MKKERFKLTPSVYLILIKENKILLLRRQGSGYFDGHYSFPAGHLDGNETMKQAMIRETKEEIGLDLSPEDLNLIHVMNRVIPIGERIDLFFTVKDWQGEPQIMEPDKCDDLSWFDLNELPRNVIPYIGQAIRSYRNNIFYSEREGEE